MEFPSSIGDTLGHPKACMNLFYALRNLVNLNWHPSKLLAAMRRANSLELFAQSARLLSADRMRESSHMVLILVNLADWGHSSIKDASAICSNVDPTRHVPTAGKLPLFRVHSTKSLHIALNVLPRRTAIDARVQPRAR